MRLGAIVDYLTERWDEEEDTLSRIMSQRSVYRFFQDHGDRLLADITAKRKTLAECQAAVERDGEDAGLALAVLHLLAQPYADRHDFPGRSASAR